MVRKHDKTCKTNDRCDACWDKTVKSVIRGMKKSRKAEPDHPFWKALDESK